MHLHAIPALPCVPWNQAEEGKRDEDMAGRGPWQRLGANGWPNAPLIPQRAPIRNGAFLVI